MEQSGPQSIDQYLEDFSGDTRERLDRVRALISGLVPEATETISYGIPTFDLNGKHLVHFAGYAKHIGLYPTPSGMVAFAEELSPYQHGKGSARFPLTEPLPEELIERIVEFRVGELTGK